MKKKNAKIKATKERIWDTSDEGSMILEQHRQAREKKKKRSRRKRQIAACLVLVLIVGGIWYAGWGRNLLVQEEDSTVKIEVGKGQEIIYAELTSVRGNEIIYTVAQEMQSKGGFGGGSMPEGMPEGGFGGGSMPEGMPEGGFGGSSMPEGMPEGGFERGSMPEGGFERGSMPEDMMNMFGGTTATASEGAFTYNDITYQLTEETVTTQIPVGTDVTTRLGTVTTFSRLAAGDKVALVVEEEDGRQIIMAVYVIG